VTNLLRRLCEALGISWVWWQWRWINFKNRVAAAFSTDSNVARRLLSKQKVCRCGALAGASDRTCQVCGRPLPSSPGWFLYKMFGLVMPGVSVATALITGAIVVDFAVLLLRSGAFAILAPSSNALLSMGALFSPLVAGGEWWRLCTCTFLHIGIIHLAFNMAALLSVSHFLEEEIGSARYAALYLMTALGGSAASYFFRPYPVVAAGASGAIFGIIGFSIIYFHRLGGYRGGDVKRFMIRWAIYGLVFGLFMGADNLAHIGGFVTGAVVGMVMEQREDQRKARGLIWGMASAGLIVLFVASFALLFLSWR